MKVKAEVEPSLGRITAIPAGCMGVLCLFSWERESNFALSLGPALSGNSSVHRRQICAYTELQHLFPKPLLAAKRPARTYPIQGAGFEIVSLL